MRAAGRFRRQSSVCKRTPSPRVRASERQTAECQTPDTASEPGRTLARRRSAVVWRSPPAICRIDGTTTEGTSLPSFLAPESQPRHAHAPPRTTDGLVSATATECTAHTETPPWSPSLPALGHRPLKRGMDGNRTAGTYGLQVPGHPRNGCIPAAFGVPLVGGRNLLLGRCWGYAGLAKGWVSGDTARWSAVQPMRTHWSCWILAQYGDCQQWPLRGDGQ